MLSSDALTLTKAPTARRPFADVLQEWLTTVDHKRLGLLYIAYGLFFLVVGGVEATVMRIQLVRAHNDFVSPQAFNQMFTMHGTTMIFFVAMPLVFGFANYLVPLMIGARDMAFPRLLAWLSLTMAGLVILAVSPLTAAQVMLVLDRYLGAHFFDTQAGGSAVVWMHFFWVFGHPEVYVLVIPAFAIASEVIPVFSRKAIFGYPVMVAATVAIAFISMSVWAHHMFTVGMTSTANNFFVLTTMAIAVPTGIKIFNWLATMWGGKIQFKAPMLFCTAFLFQFLIAGLTGIMLGSAPFTWHLANSYFVVAHFHYVILGAIIFCIFAGIYYWFPKASGRMYSEKLARWHFWLFLIGFHLTFDFMHIPGLLGMPRRIYTYEPGRGWDVWNLIVTVGVFFQAAGILFFVANLIWSYLRGRSAGRDPWDAWTLEWSTTSPPPEYNFASLPSVKSRRPLWDLKHPEDPDWQYE